MRIGIFGPFTGPVARTGDEFKGAAQMAFEAINYKIGDYKVELVWIDEQSDPAKAVVAYEEAVTRHKIDFGCLNWHSSDAVATMEVTAKYKIPHFFGMGATGVVNEKYNSDRAKYGYWMAKGWPMPEKLMGAYVQAIEDAIQRGLWKPATKTAAIWGEDTDWGRSTGKTFREQLTAAGWKIAAEEYFRIDETDFYPLHRKFKDANVELLTGTATAPAALSAFIKQAREVGIKGLIVADGLGRVGEWYKLTGEASDGVIDQIPGWTTPAAKKFAEDFKAKWNIEPSPSAAGLAYDGTNFCIKIAQRALDKYGKIDKETVYKIGQEEVMTGQLTYTGGIIMKEYKYTNETAPDPVVGEDFFFFPVLQYSKGVGKVIFPPAWKEADLQPPQ
ncbi:MAG: ABC transporter substrate-binding protein [Anaerolineales bacterium]|nr:ABC transporter substrate-binding protein [Anaerolineales bacterium]MDW8447574.1 ABC transporter substrate-binding protein [Anaerolineales bacterium]